MCPIVSSGPAQAQRQPKHVPLAKCSACRTGFTVRSEGLYPGRQFQLDVVADVAAAVAVGGAPAAASARTVGASATSARRWVRWIAALASVTEIVALTARLDPDAPAGAALPAATGGPRGNCAAVLAALEQIGGALARVGVRCVERTGLGRLLGWQLRVHGVVCRLRDRLCQSTAMAAASAARPP